MAPPIYEKNAKEIENLLDLPIREKEKHKFGEVMTPQSLIEEVLDHLPAHVWRNPHLKWFDPAAGIGNFFIVVFHRLMHGLSRKISNPKERAQHIVEKMLYMNELNPENAKRARQLFGPNANITTRDFLEEGEFPPEEPFDIILENPPYQIANEGPGKWGAKGRSHTLWPEFIEKSLSLLTPDGCLGAITPATWRSPEHPLLAELKDKRHLKYLHIYDKQAGLDLFHAQTRFDIYVVVNGPAKPSQSTFTKSSQSVSTNISQKPSQSTFTKSSQSTFTKSSQSVYLKPLCVPEGNTNGNSKKPFKEKTELVDEKGKKTKIYLQEWPFLPNYFYNEIKELLIPIQNTSTRKTRKVRPPIKTMAPIYHSNLYSSKVLSQTPTGRWKIPIVHTITKNGLGILYSNRKETEHIGKRKVLLNFNEKQYPHNDFKGEYGMSQLTFGIPIQNKREGDALVTYINSPFFKEVIKATKWGVFYTNYKMFSYFRFPNLQH